MCDLNSSLLCYKGLLMYKLHRPLVQTNWPWHNPATEPRIRYAGPVSCCWPMHLLSGCPAPGPALRDLLGWKRDLPEQEERARLLREVQLTGGLLTRECAGGEGRVGGTLSSAQGTNPIMLISCQCFNLFVVASPFAAALSSLQVGAGLLKHFKGQAAELIAAAAGSAVALVNMVTAHFPGFRDHAVYRGRQVSRSAVVKSSAARYVVLPACLIALPPGAAESQLCQH